MAIAVTDIPKHGLPRQRRLNSPTLFNRVFTEGTRINVGPFSLVASLNDVGNPRLGLAITKRVAHDAVDRNRLKRLVRESFRAKSDTLPAVDIVVFSRTTALILSNQLLFNALDRAWEAVGFNKWE